MRCSIRLTLAAFVAFAVGANGVAQPVAAVQTQTGMKVRLRIDPAIGERESLLRAAIAASTAAEVAEPADFVLSADAQYPDHVELRPANTAIDGSPAALLLGGQSSGDAAAILARILPVLQRRQSLLALGDRPLPAGLTICKAVGEPHQCIDPSMARLLGPDLATVITNRSSRKRYVAMFHTNAELGIRAVAMADGAKLSAIDPGATLVIPDGWPMSSQMAEIMVVADRPFDPASFEQQSPFTGRSGCFARLYPDCFADLAPLPELAGFAAVRQFYDDQEPGPAMGGGFVASRGDSDWMVQIYSTIPYTPEEIAADEKLPPATRKYLKQRTPEERAHSCGGVIIAPDLVLTAAHCVATGRFLAPNTARVFADRRVRIGALRLGKGGETRAIAGVAVHAGYTGLGSGLPNDIALLLVKSDDRIRLNPRPLAITQTPPAPASTVTGLGWGFTKSVAPNSNMVMSMSDGLQRNPELLQQAPLEVLATGQCARRLPGQLKPGMICLVTPKSIVASGGSPTFSCRGDSGGPLVRDYGGSGDELVGLTSWSNGCGFGDGPSVYTDVAYFRRWIADARRAIQPGQVVRVPQPARAR